MFKLASSEDMLAEAGEMDPEVQGFIRYCCAYDRLRRPTTQQLLQHPFLLPLPTDLSV